MNFVACDIKNVGVYKKTKNQNLLSEFTESGLLCARVENWSYSNAYVAARSLRASIARFKLPHIKVVARRGEIYLVNTLVE